MSSTPKRHTQILKSSGEHTSIILKLKVGAPAWTTTKGRAELANLLDFVRSGDVLVVTRVNRLARSIGDLQDIMRDLGSDDQGRLAPRDRSRVIGRDEAAALVMLRVGLKQLGREPAWAARPETPARAA
ncbi:recombinase family protein [Azospirillum canadense]|uniref:recombinase family protein n=1 Tax=Azospirillum canadense TaxID=403962 RepID=UPI0029CAB4DA|nr:recombinase family protein [Azospirillum canadense]MCW2240974.1 hypothetical protein [Azospirillum canadense]